MDTYFGLYPHFHLELALETWAKASLTHSLWVHDLTHTHSLANFQWLEFSVHSITWICLATSPYPTFFANVKPIFETDCANRYNMWPKSDDTKGVIGGS